MLFPRLRILGTDMLTTEQNGFTLIEIMISVVILSVAILGLGASTSQMMTPVGEAEIEFLAMQAAEDRLAEISLDPRYGILDSLYAGADTAVLGLPGHTRTTGLTRTQAAGTGGKVVDYWTVTVAVTGGRLTNSISRKLVIGAP